MSKQIETILTNGELAINNALQVSQLSQALAVYGYSAEKLNMGKELLQKAKAANEAQQKEYGEQYASTAQLDTQKTTAHKQYIVHVKLARILFEKDSAAYTALQLGGARKESISGYLGQAETFYSNLLANNQWVEQFQQFNIQQEKLHAGQQAVNQLRNAYAAQLKESGEAQKATETRDALVDQFEEWYSMFIKIARIALDDDKQMLEMLGVKA